MEVISGKKFNFIYSYRFPQLMGALLPQEAASLIIDAQRRNYENKSIPSYFLPILKILRYVNYVNKNTIIIHTIYFQICVNEPRDNSL